MSPRVREVNLPTFRRATAEDAQSLAVSSFQRGERVDMNAIAAQLDIGRSTLYRWVGDREKLMDRVILISIGHLWERSRSDADGEGIELALDAVARFMHNCVEYVPLTQFAQREPNLALRVLLDPDGLVTTALQRTLSRNIRSVAPNLVIDDESIGVLVLTATALIWANVAASREPNIDATIGIMRTVLSTPH